MFDSTNLIRVLLWMKQSGRSEFSTRDCFEGVKGTIKSTREVQQTLDVLARYNLILPIPKETRSVGRPPSPRYSVDGPFGTAHEKGTHSSHQECEALKQEVESLLNLVHYQAELIARQREEISISRVLLGGK